jgi:hypothetical protein
MKIVGFEPITKPYYNVDAGFAVHGDEYVYVLDKDFDPTVDYNGDCYHQTNLLKPKFLSDENSSYGNKYHYILDQKKPILISESRVFREYEGYKRFGWNDYGWCGEFNNSNVGPERWNAFERKHNVKINDWKSTGDAIIIMGQKGGDSALTRMYKQGYSHQIRWVIDIVAEIRKYSDRKIIFRPHPRGRTSVNKLMKHKNLEISDNVMKGGNQGGAGLDADLARAHCVITFNSLSGVEAATRGIPVFALDHGSMVWPIAHKDLSKIEDLNYDIDIQDWKNKVAYTFWNKEEVAAGEMWAHLKPAYFK